jgi:hypothetical protein
MSAIGSVAYFRAMRSQKAALLLGEVTVSEGMY